MGKLPAIRDIWYEVIKLINKISIKKNEKWKLEFGKATIYTNCVKISFKKDFVREDIRNFE